MADTTIAVIIGSLRKGSFTRAATRALESLAPAGLRMEEVLIGDLTLYNQDFDDEKRPPAEWTAFRDRVRPMHAVLWATPEYNRSVPGVLKNALDVGSRPYGQSVWSKKPAAVFSNSPGAIGGFGANHHLRQSLVFLDMPVLQQPEAYVGNVNKLITPDGGFADDSARKFFQSFMDAFAAHIALHAR